MKRTGERAREIRALNRTLRTVLDELQPPEDLTVNEWADRYRVLPGSSAEAGLWRTSRTPYLEEPMRAFTDPKVESIVMAAASQVGKSEFELNVIGYIIDQEPGNILYVHPNLDDAKRFSRQRVSPMIRAAKRLKAKVRDPKSVRSGDTVLQKLFPGGSLTLVGSNSPSALASIPCRYIIGDECDRLRDARATRGSWQEQDSARFITANRWRFRPRRSRARVTSRRRSLAGRRSAGGISAPTAARFLRSAFRISASSTRRSPADGGRNTA